MDEKHVTGAERTESVIFTSQLPQASIRTAMRLPFEFDDGLVIESTVYSFDGLVDGQEHLALGLGAHREVPRPLVRLHKPEHGAGSRAIVKHLEQAGGYLLYLPRDNHHTAVQMLRALRCYQIDLLTNRSNSAECFGAYGIMVHNVLSVCS